METLMPSPYWQNLFASVIRTRSLDVRTSVKQIRGGLAKKAINAGVVQW